MDTNTGFKRVSLNSLSSFSSNKSNSNNNINNNKQESSFSPFLLAVFITIMAFCCELIVADRALQNNNQQDANNNNKNLDQLAVQHHDSRRLENGGALEAELNNIVQQHDALDNNNKQLAEAIISRLMVENLTGSNLLNGVNELDNEISSQSNGANEQQAFINQEQVAADLNNGEQATTGPSGPEALRLRKIMSALHNYEANLATGGINGGLALVPYPILPSGQAATMKRAAMKMGNFLQQQQQRQTGSQYARNNFDFGLGKRPDSALSGGNILRYGDVQSVGQIQPVSQFGKRPSSHRYDFGLGKRVASPAYPRYDFGLGKRVPNRIRYDFGLGK